MRVWLNSVAESDSNERAPASSLGGREAPDRAAALSSISALFSR